MPVETILRLSVAVVNNRGYTSVAMVLVAGGTSGWGLPYSATVPKGNHTL